MKDMLQVRATVDDLQPGTNSYVLAMVLKSDMGKALPSRAREIADSSIRTNYNEKDV